MAYTRFTNTQPLPIGKKELLDEYIEYYRDRIEKNGLGELNVKIPGNVFAETMDTIGEILVARAKELAREEGPVREFLHANPLPPHMCDLLPDEFRIFALLLNALKGWVAKESLATDKYLLGRNAKKLLQSAVDRCLVDGGELGDDAQLHHPMRDGRPPILISYRAHARLENQVKKDDAAEDGSPWARLRQARRTIRGSSWAQLREGCLAIVTGTAPPRPRTTSQAKAHMRHSGLSAEEILHLLDEHDL